MKQQDAINLLKDIVLMGRQHKYYHKTVEVAKECRAFITGEGVEKYVPQFPRREDEKAYKQRLDITVNVTETVCGNVIDPQYKLPRSNSIEKRLFYLDRDNKKEDAMKDLIDRFWDGKYSLDSYMGKSWVELNNLDPNAFVVIDWKYNADGQRVRPYPVEYLSKHVINYNKQHGDLRWVCVHRPPDEVDPEMYILYTKDYTVMFRRVEDKDHTYKDITYFQKFPIPNYEKRVAAVADSELAYFDVFVHKPHNLGKVPGFFVGFITDMATRNTYASAIHKAIPILKKIVKANSELDLILSLHTFPQKVQYVNPCPECNGNGRLVSGVICDVCDGTKIDRKDIHESSQDVMYVPRPKDKEDQMDLSKMVHYVEYSVDLFKAVDEFVDKNIRRCKEAVYNSEVFTRGNVPETAYQKNLDLQNVYDALWPMAEAYKYTYNFIVDVIARVAQLDKGLVHHLSFKKDFKMKSLTDLYEDLAKVGQSGADEFVKRGIEDDIAKKLYEDSPRSLLRYHTMNHFFPFSGKTKEEIQTIMTTPRLVKEEVKVLYAGFAYIFDELDMEYRKMKVDFYRIPREEQKAALDRKVKEIVQQMKEEEVPDINMSEDES